MVFAVATPSRLEPSIVLAESSIFQNFALIFCILFFKFGWSSFQFEVNWFFVCCFACSCTATNGLQNEEPRGVGGGLGVCHTNQPVLVP